jgi:hypothetical protein
METENILAVNVPNMVSITIMALVGGLLIGLIGKAVQNAAANSGG